MVVFLNAMARRDPLHAKEMNFFDEMMLASRVPMPIALTKAKMSRRTVLLVEDEPLITLLYQDVLHDSEYMLLEPLSCEDHVVEFLKENRADLAIVDLFLEDGPCLAVIEKLAELDIPVLIVSGHGDAERIAQERGLPLMYKPFDEGTLLDALSKLLVDAPD